MKAGPPKKALEFLRWFCREDYIEEIEGDLTEVFEKQYADAPNKAKWKFSLSVVRYFRPAFMKSFKNSYQSNPYSMYKSYFIIGWRTLTRNMGYSLINIGGLAMGMMVSILTGLWIYDEISFNKHFANHDTIAQVAEKGIRERDGSTSIGTTMTYPLSTALSEQYVQHFQRVARVSNNSDVILSSADINISAKGNYVGEAFPEMFSLTMIHGTRAGLKEMNSILLSTSLAKSIFGTTDAVNRTLRLNNTVDVIVTGVYEDLPMNTEFSDRQFFAPWALYQSLNKWIEQRALTDWRNHFLRIYVQIDPNTTFEAVNANVKSALQFDPADVENKKKWKEELYLYPMSQWHLYPPDSGLYPPIKMIQLVGAIGLFVLLLACINFMNLSTARSEKRAKEVGIRKTVGSVRMQLVNQFFSESFLIVSISFVLAIGLTLLVLPGFNGIAGKVITIPWTNLWFWTASLGFIVLTSTLAGSYPALYLSSFNPIKALKGTFRVGRLASLPRKVLVVFQFSISVILIISTAVVYQQIQHAKNRPVGYDREGLIMIRKKTSDFNGKYTTLRNELKNTGVVVEVSESMGPVTDVYSGNNGWDWKGRDPNIDEGFGTLSVSHTHGKTAGWQFIDGRDFDITLANDSSSLIINESAAKFMALDHPVGEPVVWTWWVDKRVLNYTIIGVIRDMVMESPYEPVEPTMFYLKGFNGKPSWINIKINPQVSAGEAIPKIESVFKKILPMVPFEYKFVDEEYDLKFDKEARIANLASIFAILAIFISCLGLLGLASFVAERRTKEIGVRKVMGASVVSLWKMLSKDFVLLIVISCVIASPPAYYFLQEWLLKFQYHTEISAWVFILTVFGAVTITLLTVSYQAIKAALMNPVNSLKTE